MQSSLQEILFSQGFGTRRQCNGLVSLGRVAVGAPGCVCDDPTALFDTDDLRFWVEGQAWTFQARAYLMLHKPAGFECSQRPGAWPSVYSLLPVPLRQRGGGAAAGVQAIGRLDQDTTGLLLMSDDGAFIHKMSSPRHHVPKVYQVTVEEAWRGDEPQRLLAGVTVRDERHALRAAACRLTGERTLELTLTEGKHHQVKRMLAAVQRPVLTLHRSRVGGLELPADLQPGAWRWLQPQELTLLRPAA